MTKKEFSDFKDVVSHVIGSLDVFNPDAIPFPWFCKKILRDRDLQWAGYCGTFYSEKRVFAFGINLEFYPAWVRKYPKVSSKISQLSGLIMNFPNYIWRWWGRPGFRMKNPSIEILSPDAWLLDVNLDNWLFELKDIIDRKKTWKNSGKLMRPQLQVMTMISTAILPSERDNYLQAIEKTKEELETIIEIFR